MPDGDSPPSEFRIWKWGENKTLKGVVKLDKQSAQAVVDAFNEHGIELAIDYEHQTFNAEENGKPAPAAGWFTPAIREDGLWATSVRWTDEAAGFLKARQYRYFSPTAILDSKSRKPVRLMPMALTNWPATKDIEPLVARADQPETESKMKSILVALGLKAEADETEAFAAVSALREFERDTMATLGAKTLSEAAGALLALKVKADKADAAEAELSKFKDEQAAKEKAAVIDQLILRGVAPAKRGDLEKQELGALKVALSLLPEKAAPAVAPSGDVAPANHGLSAIELEVIKNTGIKPEDFIKHKAAYKRGFQKVEE